MGRPDSHSRTLKERGLDFEDCAEVLAGPKFEAPDDWRDYREPRMVTIGLLRDRTVVVVWTLREGLRRIISMRKANDREEARFRQRLAKVDAHVITPEEYDEIPELTDEWFAKATPKIGDRIISKAEFRRAVAKVMGRPRSANPKKAVIRCIRQANPGFRVGRWLGRGADFGHLSASAHRVGAWRQSSSESGTIRSAAGRVGNRSRHFPSPSGKGASPAATSS
jgi:uncharacterized protein